MCGDLLATVGPYPLCGLCKAAFSLRSGYLCRVCSMELLSEREICLRCRQRSFSFSSNYSLYVYDDRMREILRQYKTRNTRSLAAFFAERVGTAIMEHYSNYMIVPVPYRKRRKKQRGWDQVEEICRRLHRDFGFTFAPLLYRTGSSAQKTLDYKARLSNLEGRIRVRRSVTTAPPKVLLLDDVFTTGATGDACAAVLKDHGVKEIRMLTLAID